MIRKWLVHTIFSLAIPAIAMAGARSQTFDGITIIELADEAGWEAITGYELRPVQKMGGGQYIVTFVSAQGSYAAIQSSSSDRACIAWAAPGSYTGTSITFGLPASTASMRGMHPKICQPFTLTYDNPGTVRIDARNTRYHSSRGPLDEDAKIVNYSRQGKVIADIPLIALNWGLQVFDRHSIKDVRLGPLSAVKAALNDHAEIKVGKLRRSPLGIRRDFKATISKQSGQTDLIQIQGYIADKDILGWPWDALYVAWFSETLPQRSMTEVFEQAVVERYGVISWDEPGMGPSAQDLIWLYDLKGQKLTATTVLTRNSAAASESCLGTFEYWHGDSGLASFNRDIGPWGCAMIMILTHDGNGGMVSKYKVEAVSGYTLALNHFFHRLEEMQKAKQKIQEIKSTKPNL